MTARRVVNKCLTLSTICIGLGTPSWVSSQSVLEDFRDRIPVKRYVYVTLPQGKAPFLAVEDGRADIQTSLPLGKRAVFVVNNQRGLNVLIGFLNPFRFTWSSSEKAVDDPSALALAKFADSTAALFGVLSGAAAAGSAAAGKAAFGDVLFVESNKSFLKAGGTLKAIGLRDTTAKIPSLGITYAPDLLEWRLASASSDAAACLATDTTTLKKLYAAILVVDAAIYSGAKSDAERSAAQYATRVGQAKHALFAPDQLGEFLASLKQADGDLTFLEGKDRETELALPKATAAAEALLHNVNVPYCVEYRAYTKSVIERFTATAAAHLKRRMTATTELKALLAGAKKLVDGAASEAKFGAMHVASVQVPAGTMKDVTLIVRTRTIDTSDVHIAIADARADTLVFRVRRDQMKVAEFGPGIAYLGNVAYPRFGTDTANGKTVVASGDKDVQRMTPIVMLNLLSTRSWSDFVNTGLQLGIGAGKNYPMFLAGLVFRYSGEKSWALSVGGALPWYQELTKLKIGAPVSGTAQIEKDLRFKLGGASLYLGLQKGL